LFGCASIPTKPYRIPAEYNVTTVPLAATLLIDCWNVAVCPPISRSMSWDLFTKVKLTGFVVVENAVYVQFVVLNFQILDAEMSDTYAASPLGVNAIEEGVYTFPRAYTPSPAIV